MYKFELLVFFSLLTRISCRQVILFDTSRFNALNWKTWSLDGDPSEHGWQEESLPFTEDGFNSRSYVTCDVRRPYVNNWLRLPLIKVDGSDNIQRNARTSPAVVFNASNKLPPAQRLWVEVTFTSRDCKELDESELGPAVSCKETFALRYYETDLTADFTDMLIHAHPIKSPSNNYTAQSEFRLIGWIAADSGRFSGRHDVAINREVRSIPVTKKGVYFAFQDEGACVSLLKIRVYYEICDETVTNFAHFPSSAVGPSLTSVVKVTGRCVDHATIDPYHNQYIGGVDRANPQAQRPQQVCKADGHWDLLTGSCQCLPGYRSEGSDLCSPCPMNSFKEGLGIGVCQTCPPSSHAPKEGSIYCQCVPGSYRAHDDPKSAPCTRVPSTPLNFKVDSLGDTWVEVSWSAPVDVGGRPELWYNLECKHCPSRTIYQPENHRTLKATGARLSALTPGQKYVLVLTAENALSAVLKQDSFSADRRTLVGIHQPAYIRFATARPAATKYDDLHSSLDIFSNDNRPEVKIDHVTEHTILLTWRLPKSLDDHRNDVAYQVRFRRLATDFDNVRKNFSDHVVENVTWLTVENLTDDTEYEFQVRRLLPKDRHSLWSHIKTARTNRASNILASTYWDSSSILKVALPIVGGFFLGIVLLLFCCCYFRAGQWYMRLKLCFCCFRHVNKTTWGEKYQTDNPVLTIESASARPNFNSGVHQRPHKPHFGSSSYCTTTLLNNCSDVCRVNQFSHDCINHHAAGAIVKPYVEPSNYENPADVLNPPQELPPDRIEIMEVVGEGEFGDVCRGFLILDINLPISPYYASGKVHTEIANTIQTNSSTYQDLDAVCICRRSPSQTNFLALCNKHSTMTRDQIKILVAVKRLKSDYSAKDRRDFLCEAYTMDQFRHPNVVELIGVVSQSHPAFIVSEFMHNGSLNNFLKHKEDSINDVQLTTMLLDVAKGMKYLTDRRYIHRDLAARNVLVDLNLTCKIADFGLSRRTYDDNCTYQTDGGKIPVRWTAPEAVSTQEFTVWSDVWSYGICAWEVMSYGKRPYSALATNAQVMEEVQKGYRLPQPTNCPDQIYNLMRACWNSVREQRPDFGFLCQTLNILLANSQ